MLELGPHGAELGRRAVAHVHEEPFAEEGLDLPELDVLQLLDVAGGLQHHEEAVVVLLELGALVGLEGVLDGELVEVERLADGGELLSRRLEQPDPDEAVGLGQRGVGGRRVEAPFLADATHVEGAVDDHRRIVARRATSSLDRDERDQSERAETEAAANRDHLGEVPVDVADGFPLHHPAHGLACPHPVEPRHLRLAHAAEVGQPVEEHLAVEVVEVGRAEVLARGQMDGCGVVGQSVEVQRVGHLRLLGLPEPVMGRNRREAEPVAVVGEEGWATEDNAVECQVLVVAEVEEEPGDRSPVAAGALLPAVDRHMGFDGLLEARRR